MLLLVPPGGDYHYLDGRQGAFMIAQPTNLYLRLLEDRFRNDLFIKQQIVVRTEQQMHRYGQFWRRQQRFGPKFALPRLGEHLQPVVQSRFRLLSGGPTSVLVERSSCCDVVRVDYRQANRFVRIHNQPPA